MSRFLRIRTIALLALALSGLSLPACKSQDPAVLLTVDGAYRIPLDVDSLRVDVYDAATGSDGGSGKFLVTQSFALAAGQNFPFTVTLVDSGASHPDIKVIATATLGGNPRPVGLGDVEVLLKDGATVKADITLADQ